MGIFTSESEQVSPVGAARLFKAIVLDYSNVWPKALPGFIQSAEIIEGDGGSGSIKKLTLADGYVKHKVEALDAENFVYHYSIIEGTVLPENVEKISNEYKLVPNADGGCIVKSISKYYTKGDEQLTQEFLNVGKEKSASFTKAVEAYIFANPDYN
ncbi:hypothetical protein PIB30_031788 [Stylosanthes scabra]|uniref:Bet v I/Major latex protein domain-containing protein n=1 Tax=Stylosanthes scabra TaxID=79078 RepID=A0ABU6Z9M2_9FABA|nr:hypothetical protein [Stylosanthes scabra]